MKFSGKMSLKIILRVTKNQGFTLSLEDAFFETPWETVWWILSMKRVHLLPNKNVVEQDIVTPSLSRM